jgi:hypothetical protein
MHRSSSPGAVLNRCYRCFVGEDMLGRMCKVFGPERGFVNIMCCVSGYFMSLEAVLVLNAGIQ